MNNAKTRRHGRRKSLAIARAQDKALSLKIELAITGTTSKVNKALTLCGFRNAKQEIVVAQRHQTISTLTARAKEKRIMRCIPLI